MENDEQMIIADCQRGEFEKFSLLYDKYARKIYRFIYFKTHHKETAEDLTSLTFMKALEKIKSFNGGKSSFSAWIYAIARNNVIDHYRTSKNDFNIDDVWDLSGNEDIARDAELRQKLGKVEEYLKTLKADHREIIILRVWEDMSYKEIAEITGKSEGNSKMIFFRAMKELKEKMPLELLVYFLLLRF